MKAFFIYFSLFATLLTTSQRLFAQTSIPYVEPTAEFSNSEKTDEQTDAMSGSAPITGTFAINPTVPGGWTEYYEWRFTHENETTPYLIRYEQETSLTFTDYGTHKIGYYALFTQGTDSIVYTADSISCSVSQSKLEMPNAFSPNGDNVNDIYKAKDGYQSIIDFHATIFNRWGQKIYEWSNPAEGWDGTFHGTPVKEGVYYVLVKATGSDGKKYVIKRDVNLLRGFREYDD